MEGVEETFPSYEDIVQEEARPTTPGAGGGPSTSEPQSRTESDSPMPETPDFEVDSIVQLSSDDEEGPRGDSSCNQGSVEGVYQPDAEG